MASSSAFNTRAQQPDVNEEEILEEVLIPANPNNISIARRTLVGKIIANKAVNRAAAKDIIAKAWAEYDEVSVSDLGGNKFLITFDNENHSREAMRKAAWFIMNKLMCVEFWIPEVSPHEVFFDLTPVWIQIHNLPMKYLNSVNAATILRKVGKVVEIEEPIVEGRILRTIIRARVILDITIQLPSGCWIPRKGFPWIWAIYKYERLQDLCFNCGIIGHEQRHCKVPRVMLAYCSSIPKYDQILSIMAAKPIVVVLQEHVKKYGNSTVDTARKFFKGKRPEQRVPKTKIYN